MQNRPRVSLFSAQSQRSNRARFREEGNEEDDVKSFQLDEDVPHVKPLGFDRFNNLSDDLVRELGPIALDYSRPVIKSERFNYSYVDPASAAAGLLNWEDEEANRSIIDKQEIKNLSPKRLVTNYLRTQNMHWGEPNLSRIFPRAVCRWLQARNWEITDVVTWAWILQGQSGDISALRLKKIWSQNGTNISDRPDIPQFIIPLLLKRRSLTAQGLQSLLTFTWSYMDQLFYTRRISSDPLVRSPFIPNPFEDVIGMHDFIFMIIVIRLLRRARDVWPAAFVSIAHLACQHLDGVNFHKSDTQIEDRVAPLAFMYNRLLTLLALPSRLNPVESFTYRLEAQFTLLKRMSLFDPPLVVSREGYRAVTSTHLLHQKSEEEIRWAELKRESWPPWKEEKLGIDADVGPEYGVSSAMEVLRKSKEAGNAAGDWEDGAKILSGWDTDNTPTIQSRLVSQPRTYSWESNYSSEALKRPLRKGLSIHFMKETSVWIARIKASRTVEEAWAAFLQWKAENGSKPPAAYAYKAMLDILIRARDPLLEQKSHESEEDGRPFLPGDTLHVRYSSSPHSVSTRTPPVDVDEFIQDMIAKGIRLEEGLLSQVLLNASSFGSLLKYLEWAGISLTEYVGEESFANLSPQLSADQEETKLLSHDNLCALVRSLVRFGRTWPWPVTSTSDLLDPLPNMNPLKIAVDVAFNAKLKNPRVWSDLLCVLAVAKSGVSLEGRQADDRPQGVQNWETMTAIWPRIERDAVPYNLYALKAFCMCMTRAFLDIGTLIQQKHGLKNIPIAYRIEPILYEAPSFLTNLFKTIVLPQGSINPNPTTAMQKRKIKPPSSATSEAASDPSETTELPPLLHTPTLVQLHAYIRALGVSRDFAALHELVSFLATHSSTIQRWAAGFPLRERNTRKCMTALRVYLERSWTAWGPKCQHAIVGLDRDADIWSPSSSSSSSSSPPSSSETHFDSAPQAPLHIRTKIRHLVDERMQPEWGPWATDDEVKTYLRENKFVSPLDIGKEYDGGTVFRPSLPLSGSLSGSLDELVDHVSKGR